MNPINHRTNEYNTENTLPDTDLKEETDGFLKEKYGITEEYLRDHPEVYDVLEMIRDLKESVVSAKELVQATKEQNKNLETFIEDTRINSADTREIIELRREKHQAFKRLSQRASNIRAMLSENVVVMFANRIVNLVGNGIARPRELEGDLPGAHQFAIEYNTENTLPHTDLKEEIDSNSLETTPDEDESALPITDAFLKEKYGITEEYLRDHPEGYDVLEMIRDLKESVVFTKKLIRAKEEANKNLDKCIEDTRSISADTLELIELQREEHEVLERISQRASNIRAMTSGIANMFSMCTNGVRNLWTSERPVIGELAQANPRAIEYNVEHKIPNGDPTDNAPSIGDEKKNRAHLITFCVSVVALYVLYLKVREMFRSSSGGK